MQDSYVSHWKLTLANGGTCTHALTLVGGKLWDNDPEFYFAEVEGKFKCDTPNDREARKPVVKAALKFVLELVNRFVEAAEKEDKEIIRVELLRTYKLELGL